MIIYKSDYLTIDKKDDLLIQSWTEKQLNAEIFQKELLAFDSYSRKVRPKSMLWLQENMDFQIPETLYNWLEHEILSRQTKYGIQKMAFTIPKEEAVLQSFTDLFAVRGKKLPPTYFSNEASALNFINNEPMNDKRPKITIDPVQDEVKINIKVQPTDLQFAINRLKRLDHERKFAKTTLDRFSRLTKRELEVFDLIIKGLSSKEIAEKLFLSGETIISHRKNIKSKLHIRNLADWINYANAFGIKGNIA